MSPPISKCKFAHREHLLPSNATDLERALSLSMNPMARVGPGIANLRGFKFDPADPLLPWLIWEYGLGELLPYLIDPRRAIAEGILWQRLRGTPKALEVALSWVDTIVTVEQEPPGVHYAEFQVDTGRVIDDDEWIERVLAIVQLSAPARSRLSRMYHGYDLRRFMLDTDILGDALLSDNSGVIWWGDGYTKLSFGRSLEEVAVLGAFVDAAFVPVRASVVKYGDRCMLDWMLLDTCVPVPNPFIMHSHLFVNANSMGALDPSPFPRRKFCKAEVVPSDDGWRLGDTNACLPRFRWVETGEQLRLSEAMPLSQTPWSLQRAEVTERFDSVHAHALYYLSEDLMILSTGVRNTKAVVTRLADCALGFFRLCDVAFEWPDCGQMRRTHSRINESSSPDHPGIRERKFCKAMLVLSEMAELGEINTRTPRGAVTRIAPIPRLSDMRLGDGPEIIFVPIFEMFSRRTSTHSPAPAYIESVNAVARHHAAWAAAYDGDCVADRSRGHTISAPEAKYAHQTWTGLSWQAIASWNDLREHIVCHHSSQS